MPGLAGGLENWSLNGIVAKLNLVAPLREPIESAVLVDAVVRSETL